MDILNFIKTPPTKIVLYPDPILRAITEPIEVFDDNLRQVTEIMFDLMRKWQGVGLAAPQVGLPYRLFIVEHKGKHIFINPEVIHYGRRITKAEEGCLSLPGIQIPIERPHRFLFRAQTLEGKTEKYAFEGLMGRICIHENEHLQGILIIDKMRTDDQERITKILTIQKTHLEHT